MESPPSTVISPSNHSAGSSQGTHTYRYRPHAGDSYLQRPQVGSMSLQMQPGAAMTNASPSSSIGVSLSVSTTVASPMCNTRGKALGVRPIAKDTGKDSRCQCASKSPVFRHGRPGNRIGDARTITRAWRIIQRSQTCV